VLLVEAASRNRVVTWHGKPRLLCLDCFTMVGSKSSRRSISSNVSSSSKGSKGRRRRKAQSATPKQPVGRVVVLPFSETAPQASRSAMLWTDPKMKILKKFAHKEEPTPAPQIRVQASFLETTDSFGDEEPSRELQSDLESGSESPMLASRRASASSRRTSAAHGGYSRRTSASSRRTSADSRRTSASSYLGRRQSDENSLNASLSRASVLQSSFASFETIEERLPSHERRRGSLRPASASAVLQTGTREDRHLEVGHTNKVTYRLVKAAESQRKEQVAESLSPEEKLNAWIANREAEHRKRENASQAYSIASSRTEHQASEAHQRQLQLFDMKGPREGFLSRAGHSLRKLFVDFDLAHHSGGQARSHEARCKHLDGVFDWYEKHASLKAKCASHPSHASQEERNTTSPWIFLRKGEPSPPGSLRRPRSAAATVGLASQAFHVSAGSASPVGISRSVSAPSLAP